MPTSPVDIRNRAENFKRSNKAVEKKELPPMRVPIAGHRVAQIQAKKHHKKRNSRKR